MPFLSNHEPVSEPVHVKFLEIKVREPPLRATLICSGERPRRKKKGMYGKGATGEVGLCNGHEGLRRPMPENLTKTSTGIPFLSACMCAQLWRGLSELGPALCLLGTLTRTCRLIGKNRSRFKLQGYKYG